MEELLKNPVYRKNYVPIISFFLGTILLFSFAILKTDVILYVGLLYIFLAVFINVIYLFYLLIKYYYKKTSLEETLSRLGITLINIPITILYIYIIFNVLL